jgi:hypothetical protein
VSRTDVPDLAREKCKQRDWSMKSYRQRTPEVHVAIIDTSNCATVSMARSVELMAVRAGSVDEKRPRAAVTWKSLAIRGSFCSIGSMHPCETFSVCGFAGLSPAALGLLRGDDHHASCGHFLSDWRECYTFPHRAVM